MACGLLPAVDKQILLFERWLHEHLADVGDADHAQILRRFATWHVLPRLRTRAETRPISPVGRRYAGEQILQATALLAWLANRSHQLADCTQADIDTWSVEQANSNRVNIRAFLQWSAKTRLTRRFELPTPQSPGTAPMPERDRTALLGQVLTGEDAPLRSRAATAIRQHVLDLPAPIVATALGYHTTTTRLAAEAGTTWSSYVSGDRSK